MFRPSKNYMIPTHIVKATFFTILLIQVLIFSGNTFSGTPSNILLAATWASLSAVKLSSHHTPAVVEARDWLS